MTALDDVAEDATPAVRGGRPRRITIDLDGAWCYRAIHGHAHDDNRSAVDDPLLLEAVPRFLDVCADLDVKSTIFVVAADLRSDRYAQLIAAASAAGHDVMSHSFAHRYDLSRRPFVDIVADLRRAHAAIVDVTGVAPQGFRAPGYNLSPALLRAVAAVGHTWSSSVLPSPAYWAARAAIKAKTRLSRRRSASLLGNLHAFSPWWFSSSSAALNVTEHPITTAATLPWTGTTLALASDRLAATMTTAALLTTSADDLVFELHAADFAHGALLPADQPDAHVPLADKLRRITTTMRAVRDAR
ncbi:MAG TPA: polysaccharide deacetylase family protein [Myxococcota bacterium]